MKHINIQDIKTKKYACRYIKFTYNIILCIALYALLSFLNIKLGLKHVSLVEFIMFSALLDFKSKIIVTNLKILCYYISSFISKIFKHLNPFYYDLVDLENISELYNKQLRLYSFKLHNPLILATNEAEKVYEEIYNFHPTHSSIHDLKYIKAWSTNFLFADDNYNGKNEEILSNIATKYDLSFGEIYYTFCWCTCVIEFKKIY